jgi:hypothetical protein
MSAQTERFAWHRVVWSAPTANAPCVCGHCFGALPEVPLMVWKPDGSGASFCDACAASALIVARQRGSA